MEEIGPVVGGRRDVELVVPRKRAGVAREQSPRASEEIRRVQQVVAIGVRFRHSRHPAEIERAGGGELPDRLDLGRAQKAVLDQEGEGVPAADQRQPPLGRRLALIFQRRPGGGDELQAVAGGDFQPAGDGEKAARRETAEVGAEGLDRVKGAFAETVEPGHRGGEGIEERDLDKVVAVAAGGDEAAGFRDVDANAGGVVEMAREIGKVAPNERHNLRIQLHRVDGAGPVIAPQQHVRAAAGAEDQHPRPAEQIVRERRGLEVEIAERLTHIVIARDRGHGVAVGEDADLRRHRSLAFQAEPRRVAEGNRRLAHNREQAQGA